MPETTKKEIKNARGVVLSGLHVGEEIRAIHHGIEKDVVVIDIGSFRKADTALSDYRRCYVEPEDLDCDWISWDDIIRRY